MADLKSMDIYEFLEGGYEKVWDEVSSVDSLDEFAPYKRRLSKIELIQSKALDSAENEEESSDEEHSSSDNSDDDSPDEEIPEDKNEEDGGYEEAVEADDDVVGVPISADEDGSTVLTEKLMNKLIRKAYKQNNRESIYQVVLAFHAAAYLGQEEDDTESSKPGKGKKSQAKKPEAVYRIVSGSVFNHVLSQCLENIGPLFENFLASKSKKGESKESKDEFEVPLVPVSKRPGWKQLSSVVQSFLNAVLHFVKNLAQSEMKSFVFEFTESLVPYFAPFEKLATKFLPILLESWSSQESPTRIYAFLNIRALATTVPPPFIELCLKGMYLTFVRKSKLFNQSTTSSSDFMIQSLIDIYGIDMTASYQLGFVYIRQLAIHLRNALHNKDKKTKSVVYSWQFLNALKAWIGILSSYGGTDQLFPLIYPLVQVMIGAIRLNPVQRYYPFRLYCIDLLNKLALKTKLFIPIAPLLLEVLNVSWLNKRIVPGSKRPMDLEYILKTTKKDTMTKVFQSAIVETSLLLLAEHFALNLPSPAFPELAIPTLTYLRKFSKDCKVPSYSKQSMILVRKIEAATIELSLWRTKFSGKSLRELEESLQPPPIIDLEEEEEMESDKKSEGVIASFMSRIDNSVLKLHAQATRDAHNAHLQQLRGDGEQAGPPSDDEIEEGGVAPDVPVRKERKKKEKKEKKRKRDGESGSKKRKKSKDVVKDIDLSEF